MHTRAAILLAGCALAAPAAAATPAAPACSYTIGVQAGTSAHTSQAYLAPLIAHLRRAMPGKTFCIKPMKDEDLTEAIKQRTVELFLSDSGYYTLAHHQRYGVTQVATTQASMSTDPAASRAFAVAVPTDSPARRVEDVAGARIAASSEGCIVGWLAFESLLASRGLNPEKTHARAVFEQESGQEPLAMLLAGKADAALLPACRLETLRRAGSPIPERLRVLESKTDGALACQRTGDLYPGDVLAATMRLAPQDLPALTVAALTMPQAQSGHRWSIANNFLAVEKILSNLKLGPYSYLHKPNWHAVWDQYGWFVVGGLALLLFWAFHTLRTRFLIDERTRELEKAHKEARSSAERLAQMERAGVVSELCSMLVHEVRQPIATLITYAGGVRLYLKKSGRSDPVLEEVAASMSAEAHRISDIVEHVRNYARAKHPARSRLQASQIASRAIKTFSASSASIHMDVALEPSPAPGLVEAEPLEMELVVVNLLKNAADAAAKAAAPDTGKIRVACTASHGSGKIRVACTASHGSATISVRDWGPDLTEEQFAALAHPTQSRKPDGLGLGLTIVRRIVEEHNAVLTFERMLPGLKASVTLPLVHPTTGEHPC